VCTNAQFLFHPSRQLAGEPAAELAHARSLQQTGCTLLPHLGWDFEQIGIEADVLVDGEVLIEAEPLRHVAEMLLGVLRVGHHVDAVDNDSATVRRHYAGQHAHRCRLSGAIGTDETEDLAAADRETQAVDRGNFCKPLGEPISRDDG